MKKSPQDRKIPPTKPDQKEVRRSAEPNNSAIQFPSWRFHKIDKDHPQWGWKEPIMCAREWKSLLQKLISYEGMTWADIDQTDGGKAPGKGSNNHFLDIGKCCKEAQDRFSQLGQYERADYFYSLRLEGKVRLYGIRDGAILILLWHDPHHGNNKGVCPS